MKKAIEAIELLETESTPFNGRIHKLVNKMFGQMYLWFYPTRQKYNKTKLFSLAIMLLFKTIKDKKIKPGDDLIQKLGL